jgi:hypothetical protein
VHSVIDGLGKSFEQEAPKFPIDWRKPIRVSQEALNPQIEFLLEFFPKSCSPIIVPVRGFHNIAEGLG